jgi:DNA invertase Pin-like site-specific DNA recombinase
MYTNPFTPTDRLVYDIGVSPKRGTKVVGYIRVSTAEQADSGAGLAAQRAAITAAAESKGWELVTILEDAGVSAKSTKGRTALAASLAMIEAGAADALVVSKLDRLSRSLLDFAQLMHRAQDAGWAIVVLDSDFDMTTPSGRLMANMLASFAEFERSMISQRTKDGLAAKKAAGVRVGRPRGVPERVRARIERERASGRSLRAIADGLNADAIPTGQGGSQWHASTVSKLLAVQ